MPKPRLEVACETTAEYSLCAEFGVDEVILKHYPALLPAVHAALAVFGSMSLAGRTKPLSLMYVTSSGFGKTAIVQMFFPAGDTTLHVHVYRSDKFTPKAFVTHAANVKKEDLEAMDMLPKLENKVLITKELAPIFRGREQDMQENFSVLISVLDGKGFTSDTGMRGQRGYDRPILFNWIGCTTPLPPSTHRMMSQLGTRLLFYEVPAKQPTEDELIEYASKGGAGTAEIECQLVVNRFLSSFFACYPVGSVPQESITFPPNHLRSIARWAQFLVAGRAEVKFERQGTNWKPVSAMPPEGPWKVVNYFKDIALGHALIHGRDQVAESDLELVGHIALSSIPGHLQPLLRELRVRNHIDTKTAARLSNVTEPTARNYLTELSLLGLVDLKKGSPTSKTQDQASLSRAYRWLKLNL